jgi:hypothetical protein
MGKHQMVKMWAKDPAHQFAWDGDSYKVDKDGFVEVPGAAVDELIHHGLETMAMKAEREKKEAKERAELAAKHISRPENEGISKEQADVLLTTLEAMKAELAASKSRLAELEADKGNKKRSKE